LPGGSGPAEGVGGKDPENWQPRQDSNLNKQNQKLFTG